MKAKEKAEIVAQLARAVALLRPYARAVCINQTFGADRAFEFWLVQGRFVVIVATADGFDVYGSLDPNGNSLPALSAGLNAYLIRSGAPHTTIGDICGDALDDRNNG
jgi:hypothetical protein